MIHTRWGIATARRAWLTKDDVAKHAAVGAARGATQARALSARRARLSVSNVDLPLPTRRKTDVRRPRQARALSRRGSSSVLTTASTAARR